MGTGSPRQHLEDRRFYTQGRHRSVHSKNKRRFWFLLLFDVG
jgi:hypothetical protein